MYPNRPISDDFARRYEGKTPPWGFNNLGYVVFKRTYARPITDDHGHETTEEWWQTLKRVVNGAQAIGANYTQAEAERLYDYMFNLKASLGGRMLWQLGTENNKRLGADSLVNCWSCDINNIKDFGWIFERLMLGGGVGFSVDQPTRLGVVRPAKVTNEDVSDAGFIVPDSREGWRELLDRVFLAYFGGKDDPNEFTYSTQLIRPYGTPIKTFGGVASGPGILVEGIEKISRVLDGAINRYPTSIEVLDICNIIGEVVVSGNVRRSALLALGLAHDREYLSAKRWDQGDIPSWRAMSNNSVYLEPDQIENLPDEFWEGYQGNGEPYGLFNLTASQTYGRMGEIRQDMTISGTNPCAEISLAHRESCNLSDIFLPNVESPEELQDISQLLYKTQKAVAAMPYLDRVSNEITSRNMRLGLGVSGLAQALDKIEWLDAAYVALRAFDREWSKLNGWPESVRLTTVKPSGTLSLLAGVTPGVHPGYAQFHVRRVRMAADDPMVQYCTERGYPIEFVRNFDGSEKSNTVVVEFPVQFPSETIVAKDMTAIKQMDLQRKIQEVWADNAVSTTVYYKLEELPEIQEYLKEHWAEMKSISFLLHTGHGFDQAPLEEIPEAEYYERLLALKEVENFHVHGLSELFDDECASGACPIR